MADNTLR